LEFSSNAFLARILDNESAEILGSKSVEIAGFGVSICTSSIGLFDSTITLGNSSLSAIDKLVRFSAKSVSTFSDIEFFFTTSTIE
jgi:hypothetical protein